MDHGPPEGPLFFQFDHLFCWELYMKYMPSINIKKQEKKGGKKNEKANIEGENTKTTWRFTLYKYLLSSISNMRHCIISPFMYDKSNLYMQVQHTQYIQTGRACQKNVIAGKFI